MNQGPSARPPRDPPNGRTVAARVLERVARDGAYAAASLDTELSRHPHLDARDRALATEIVYGALRTEAWLTRALASRASRGLPADPVVLSHLLVAAYQLCFLDRVPSHAAVDAAVSTIRAVRGARVAGFANALLRKVAQGGRADREAAILESAPAWLRAALEHAVGPDETAALLGARESESRVAVRVDGAREPFEGADRGRVSPLARLVPRAGDLRKLPGHAAGAFTLHEEGAQVVALALGARPGDRVLDVCAGRGQKTALLRERIGADAELHATDLYAEKLDAQRAEFARLGLAPAITEAVDWTLGSGHVPGGLDRVLVDAPCTGTGTLRHRPEILKRLEPGDPARLGALARDILRRAAERVKPGGRVVFAVCSVLEAECEDVVRAVADVLEPAPFDAPDLPFLSPGQTSVRLTPLAHGTDGFFIASLRRRG